MRQAKKLIDFDTGQVAVPVTPTVPNPGQTVNLARQNPYVRPGFARIQRPPRLHRSYGRPSWREFLSKQLKELPPRVWAFTKFTVIWLAVIGAIAFVSDLSGQSSPVYYWEDYAPRNAQVMSALLNVVKSFVVARVIVEAMHWLSLGFLEAFLHGIAHWEGWGPLKFKISIRGLVIWFFFFLMLTAMGNTLIPMWSFFSDEGFLGKIVIAALITFILAWFIDNNWTGHRREWETLILGMVGMLLLQAGGADPFLLNVAWTSFA